MADKSKVGMVALAAISASLAGGSPAQAQSVSSPLKVGIIDTRVEAKHMIGSMDGVSIQVENFLAPDQKPAQIYTAVRKGHGGVVASSFVEQARKIDPSRPIQIYSAQAFFKLPDEVSLEEDRQPRTAVNFGAATRALDWFKKNDVKVVVTAFMTTENSPHMQRFMQHAKDLGLVVFASTNNASSKVLPFPARDPYAIAVSGNNKNLDFTWNRSMDKWVTFQADGSIPNHTFGVGGRQELENGSSFAVARAAAFGAFVVARNPEATRDEIAESMRIAADADNKRGVSDLSGSQVVARFNTTLSSAVQIAGVEAQPVRPTAAMQAQVAKMASVSR